MRRFSRQEIKITTDGDEDFTGYLGPVYGYVATIRYVPDATAPLTTADLTLTGESTGTPILAATGVDSSAITWQPRGATHSTAGAALVFASAGEAVADRIAIADERIKVVVASGGDTKAGTLHIVLEV